MVRLCLTTVLRRRVAGLGLTVVQLACIARLFGGRSALAAVLNVGPGGAYPTPSAAIAAAKNGDTVLVAPGTYYDCAIVRQEDLTIAGSGDGAVLTDKPCAGKALLVIDGRDITVRNLTLARVRVPDGNGAGIRAEGINLTIDHVNFINDQDGILAAYQPNSTIVVRNSSFAKNGDCQSRCGHAIDAGNVRMLRVVNSDFRQAAGGNHISSSAQHTELLGDTFVDEGGRMTGALVHVNGGALMMQGSTVLLSSAASRPGTVLVTGSALEITVRRNTLREPADANIPLVRNWTGVPVTAADNSVPDWTNATSDRGELYHRLRTGLARLRGSLHAVLGSAKHAAAGLLRRVL